MIEPEYEKRLPPLKSVQVRDAFWSAEMELVRSTVLPYQWELLNDAVPGAAPSYCIHNFKAAAELTARKAKNRGGFVPPAYTFRGFEALPEDPAHPEPDRFYGFVFQDSDLAKWLEAVAGSLAQHPDPALEATADRAIELICAAQQENGYLDTYYILNGMDAAFTNLRDHHELYCFGHLAESAVAYREATGKDRLLRAVCRYADLIDETFRAQGGCQGYPGHEIAEMALFRLYGATGNERYRALAQRFLDRRGQRPYYFDRERPGESPAAPGELRYRYNQAHLPVREQSEAVGHAVRAMYLYSGMADSARLTGDPAMLAACRRLWADVTARKMYVTGGVGSTAAGEAFTFAYDLPNDTAYAETCAAIGLIFFARRMLQLEPKAEYAEVLERALYNGALAGIAADGRSFFYVNPLAVRPDACAGDPNKAHVKPVRQKWFGCACCPPNLARLIETVGQYAWGTAGDTLFVHLHLGGSIRLSAGGALVTASSALPWAGDYGLRFAGCTGAPFTVAVRIPAWCGGRYTLQGAEGALQREQDGYLYLRKAWQDTDALAFCFAMEPCLVAANPHVWADEGKVCLARGPLIYCMEQADNGPGLARCRLDADAPLRVEQRELLPGYPAFAAVPCITAAGCRLEPGAPEQPLYAARRPAARQQTELRFLPYFLWANRGEGEMQVWVRTLQV